MKYFATIGDAGIIIRASESIEDFQQPRDWKEVESIRRHINAHGMQALDVGKVMTVTSDDQSYPELNSLFYQEA